MSDDSSGIPDFPDFPDFPDLPGDDGELGGSADDDGGKRRGEHFSDEELEQALEGFERDVRNSSPDESGGSDGHAAHPANGSNPAVGAIDFDDELQGLIGNKAKVAAVITRLASARLLAAFCQLSDVAADCVQGDQGAVAVLRNLNADAPESAVKDLTTVVSGMAAVLAVNRADKLGASLYLQGEKGRDIAPPILFASTASFVEDLLLGIATLDDLKDQGLRSIDSGALDRDQAVAIIAEHTRFGRGKGSIS